MPSLQVQRLYRNRCGVWCFRLRAGTADSRVSLGTKDALAAHMMAAKINDAIEAARASGMSQKNPKLSDLNIDLAALRRYELDLRNGVAKATDAADHARMMEAIDRIGKIPGGWPVSQPQPVPQPVAPAPAVLASLPVSKVAEMWLAERKQKNAPRTVYAKECHWKDFARRISGDVEVNAIGKAILVGYKAALLAEGQKAKTIDNKLMTLSDLFEFALSNGHYTAGNANPAAGLFILTRAERQAKAQKYQSFTAGDLAKFFEPDAYKRGMAEPDFYWCPLLAVYSGMRISEATGIHCEDVKTAENGVAYVFVRKSKTGAGVRNVPIAQALLDLGFLGFVERQRAAGHARLFPDRLLILDSYSKELGIRMKDYLIERGIRKAGDKAERKSFHSFRVNVITALANAGANTAQVMRIVGHKASGADDVHLGYVRDLPDLKAVVDLLKWPIDPKALRLV